MGRTTKPKSSELIDKLKNAIDDTVLDERFSLSVRVRLLDRAIRYAKSAVYELRNQKRP